MNLGTSMHALSEFGNDVKPFAQALDEAAACGFGSLMLMDFAGLPTISAGSFPACSLVDLGASDPEVVTDALTQRGLRAGAIYRACVQLGSEEEAEQTAAQLSDLLTLTARYGAPVAIPNAGAAPAPGMCVDDKDILIRRLAAAMSAALETAPPGISFAVDVHYGGVLESVADCCRLFELAPDPRAAITLNIGHMTTCHQEGWELAREHGDRVPVVAWKDHLLQPPSDYPHPVYSVELGTGDSPFERYVEALQPDDGTRLHLITFEHVPLADKPAALGRSLQYLKGLWGLA
jgi:sugar phosphate isomerase/epimerase